MGKERSVRDKEAKTRRPGPANGEREVPRGRLPWVEGRHNLLSPGGRPPTPVSAEGTDGRLLAVSVFSGVSWLGYKMSKKKGAEVQRKQETVRTK